MRPRVTFICGGELVPASRFRVHPVAEALEKEQWNVRVIHGYGTLDQKIPVSFLRRAYRVSCRIRRAIQTARLGDDGPVMVQRLALPWFGKPEVLLSQNNDGRLVFDFDDAVFIKTNGQEHKLRRKAINAVFSHSAHVVVGNSWLAQAVTADVPVTVIPTCIDTQLYTPRLLVERKGPIRIGWIGTSGNFIYLHQLVQPLAKLRAAGFCFEFVICSDATDASLFSALGAKFEKWSVERELPFLRSLDIGLMPLDDNDWCRGKCSFKIIQYMAVGCPVVASAVGMNIDVLNGSNAGWLVKGGNWEEPLVELLKDEEQRGSAGFAARQRAVDYYDTQIAVNGYKKIFEKLQ